MENKVLLKAANVSKYFERCGNKICVLEDFNIELERGTFTTVVGRSGSGKTTLLNILAGFEKPSSGTVLFEEKNIEAFSKNENALYKNQEIGFVSQSQSLLPSLTVFDNVRLPFFILNKRNKNQTRDINLKAEDLLKKFDILYLRNSYPKNLSGGETQRVLIARALINEPKIIFADEPTSSVDSEQTKEISAIFNAIAKEGKSVLAATHDTLLSEASQKQIKIED